MDCHINCAHIVECNFKHLQCITMDWYDSAHTVTFKQLQCTSMSWHNWGDIEFFFDSWAKFWAEFVMVLLHMSYLSFPSRFTP